jgi:hypothetical protein
MQRNGMRWTEDAECAPSTSARAGPTGSAGSGAAARGSARAAPRCHRSESVCPWQWRLHTRGRGSVVALAGRAKVVARAAWARRSGSQETPAFPVVPPHAVGSQSRRAKDAAVLQPRPAQLRGAMMGLCHQGRYHAQPRLPAARATTRSLISANLGHWQASMWQSSCGELTCARASAAASDSEGPRARPSLLEGGREDSSGARRRRPPSGLLARSPVPDHTCSGRGAEHC